MSNFIAFVLGMTAGMTLFGIYLWMEDKNKG
jgi:hypothetical protein